MTEKTNNEREYFLEKIREVKARSAWDKGVKTYMFELLDEYTDWMEDHGRTAETSAELILAMLNGAESWQQYSEGGCSLIYDQDICKRLSPAWVQKKYRYGETQPKFDNWIGIQASALAIAAGSMTWIWRGKTND